MTNEQKEEDPYTLGLSCSNCSNDNGYLVVDDEVKFNRLIDTINEFQVTSVCEQCSIESEINKMKFKILHDILGRTRPIYIAPFNCSICQNRIGNMVAHSQEDAKEIYDLLLLKETGMMCVSCSEAYSNREGFNNDVQVKLK